MNDAAKAHMAALDAKRAAKSAGFWEARSAEYATSRMAEEALQQQANVHAAHRRKGLSVSKTWANCDAQGIGDCGRQKILWMCGQSELSHVGRNGRRLAEIYKVTLGE